ncbi:TetR/AcrR family transcriptional regulator [Amycolatopsis pithecellobii]|uniref:TetR family transcriptional regulator n=1 Tax=Amycolatopsis pithecellobii TaxID=664692 RepID=A0A6N7YHZ8_9PSEU|nr:TetR/AcrR family transcriptional regulator [Amycolatopsis pithecellobii]MTD52515.1 TetR family transcriptional regulator [Amycolatopsis pithecellobii]
MSTTRRRGVELETAIHAAVLDELNERGYAGVTYDGVAARAATSRPVLYRRWATKAEMVLAAVLASRTEVIVLPDTGRLATDLSAILASMRENFGVPLRATMLGLLAELDAESAESVLGLLSGWGADMVAPVVARAGARGEIGPAQVPREVLALPFDLARHELTFRGTLPEERITAIVDVIVVPLLELYAGSQKPL